ncbi:hypothetical protein AB832_01070 [Flavobacteriaceae bacterium (ex Bugula neritina AB1)]|nr:hypothetical protein AB832_01070 [Flavobacteriaceae bacterium (ex Bugula neritina AB1)]
MLSILIPVYNYDITDLVANLIDQLRNLTCPYEIIILDDFSTSAQFIEKNKKIAQFSHCAFFENTSNLGRTATRLSLAKKAKFNWLLFLDADVTPLNNNFIEILLMHISTEVDFIFGGIHYKSQKPKSDAILRWLYGHKKEKKNITFRNQNPYTNQNKQVWIEHYFFLRAKKKKYSCFTYQKPNYTFGFGKQLTVFQKIIRIYRNYILPSKRRKNTGRL